MKKINEEYNVSDIFDDVGDKVLITCKDNQRFLLANKLQEFCEHIAATNPFDPSAKEVPLISRITNFLRCDVGIKLFAYHLTHLVPGMFLGQDISTLQIPENEVKVIDGYAFFGCKGKHDIKFVGLQKIGEKAFANNANLAAIELDCPGVTIDETAFDNCIGLKQIVVHNPKSFPKKIIDLYPKCVTIEPPKGYVFNNDREVFDYLKKMTGAAAITAVFLDKFNFKYDSADDEESEETEETNPAPEEAASEETVEEK